MEIDVMPGDEWTVDKSGFPALRQWRSDKCRLVNEGPFGITHPGYRNAYTNPIPFSLARQIIEAGKAVDQ